MLDRFGMTDCKAVSTPIVPGTHLYKEEILKASPKDLVLYQSMVGSLMYAMVETRPDIAYAVSVLSRYASNPTNAHISAAKRVFCYLKGAFELGITYRKGDKLVGYTDANWGNNEETRRSTGAYLFNLYGGAISWLSKRQSTVALLSCESKYIAQTHASKEAIWLSRLLKEIDIDNLLPSLLITIFANNQGAIALSKDPRYHVRTKHINIQWHFVRE